MRLSAAARAELLRRYAGAGLVRHGAGWLMLQREEGGGWRCRRLSSVTVAPDGAYEFWWTDDGEGRTRRAALAAATMEPA